MKGIAMNPDTIVVHCSASTWGDAAEFDSWHAARGWGRRDPASGKVYHIGYHAVILNGRPKYSSKYRLIFDGKIEPGRPENMVGSHCRANDMNDRSLSVCLVGMPGIGGYPTARQMDSLVHWLTVNCREHGISPDRIFQHSEFEKSKPHCASVDIKEIRWRVRERL
ncbi:MAG: peptidoglycan recognition protein family protein [Armatimonadota bacterium]